ncbi:MAG TPA: anti-sigma factor [Bryobacteraceae bacterium]|nr:anti-sigma factor [Bryobacteraceae bacterium]
MTCHSVRELIQPLLDEELDAGRKADIESHLQGCVGCSELHHELSELRTKVRAGAPYYSAPPHLAARVRGALDETERAASRWRVPWAWVSGAAAAGFAVAAVLAFVFLRPQTSERDVLAQELVASHFRSLLPGHLVDVPSSDQHTVKPWFAGKLDFSPQVKDLKAQGFELKGGRLDYIDKRPVAALIFQRRQHLINLFVWPEQRKFNVGKASFSQNGFNVVHWSSGGLAYWAISDLNGEELTEFTRLYEE